jgi:CHAD domain-containing protein
MRRARTVLGQLRDVFPSAATRPLRDGLAEAADLSAPLRDLDVLAQALRSARRKLCAGDRRALDAVVAVIEGDRQAARQQVLAGLGSDSHAALVDAYGRFTAAPYRPRRAGAPARRGDDGEAPGAPMPIAVIAAESIERAWRRLLRHGARIGDSSSIEDLHRVRIDGKKLRYLVELFGPSYPNVDLAPLIATLKRLQDCLGTINDAAVQERQLRGVAERLARDRPAAAAAALVLVGRLIERGEARAATARRRFAGRFEKLQSKENRRAIKALA